MGFEPLQPGDHVRVIQDAYDQEDIWVGVSVAAQSTGRIMSFEEYCDFIRRLNHGEKSGPIAKHFSIVAQGIQSGEYLPVRIEKFAPLSDTVRDFWAKQGHSGEVKYLAERVVLLGRGMLEKIS